MIRNGILRANSFPSLRVVGIGLTHPSSTSAKRFITLNTAINESLRASKRPTRQKSHKLGAPWRDNSKKEEGVNGDRSIKSSLAHSEFLLGTHSVIAALKLRRRKLIKLYYDKDMTSSSKTNRKLSEILSLAHEADLKAVPVSKQALAGRASVSGGMPHNGVILETLPIPFPSIDALVPSDDHSSGHFYCIPHGKPASQRVKVSYGAPSLRNPPLIAMPFSVVDTNNISAILRSAYFFSVSALALPTRSTAHPSSFSRASAGAIEAIPLLGVPDPKDFLTKCQKSGFKVLSTSLPAVSNQKGNDTAMWSSTEHFLLPTDALNLSKYVAVNPTILILGGEASGVPPELSELADATVEIERVRTTDEAGIDSLNVSVAAGIIFAAVCKR